MKSATEATGRLVQHLAADIRDSFMGSGMSLVEINLGSCADFADALHTHLAAQGIDTVITGLDYFWAEDGGIDETALSRRAATTLPPGLTWDLLTELDLPNAASHTWLEQSGFCYDAEVVHGTTNPFDFPCIRHALTEVMAWVPVRLEALTQEHEWWREAMDIRKGREEIMADLQHKLRS